MTGRKREECVAKQQTDTQRLGIVFPLLGAVPGALSFNPYIAAGGFAGGLAAEYCDRATKDAAMNACLGSFTPAATPAVPVYERALIAACAAARRAIGTR